MGDTLILKKYQQLAPTDQMLAGYFIDFLLTKSTTSTPDQKPKKERWAR